MWKALKRLLIAIGIMAEDLTNTDGINQAVVERGIRDSKERASKASEDNGKLAGSISLLKEQLKKEGRQKEELQGLLSYAASVNDEANGANYAEQLANLEETIKDNQEQYDNLELMYKQNTQIIAESIRQIQKFQAEFSQLKIKVSMSRSMEGLATMMKSSITELQGMVGGEMSESMEKLRQSAANGEGQIRATMDLAKEMGSNIRNQQEARKAKGAMLFKEYQNKIGISKKQPEVAQTTLPEKEKIKVA
jgi:phage shock protein A